MAGSLDLATLANVRGWLGISNDDSNQLLQRLISSISGQVLDCIQRSDVRHHVWSEIRDGSGTDTILLKNWPVVSVESVVIDGAVIPPALTDDGLLSAGWVLSDYSGTPPGSNQTVTLRGYVFCRGAKNVQVSYAGGYVVQGEATTVPAAPTGYAVQAPLGSWSANVRVVDASSGDELVQVSAAPTAPGEYWCPPLQPDYPETGTYVFYSSDVGMSVLIDYSYTPAALEQIVIEEIGERFRYRDRIGLRSKSLGGQETVSYAPSGVSEYVARQLIPWTSVVPIPP